MQSATIKTHARQRRIQAYSSLGKEFIFRSPDNAYSW